MWAGNSVIQAQSLGRASSPRCEKQAAEDSRKARTSRSLLYGTLLFQVVSMGLNSGSKIYTAQKTNKHLTWAILELRYSKLSALV